MDEQANTRALIGKVLLQPSLIHEVVTVRPEHLSGLESEVWRAMLGLAERDAPINVLSIDAELKHRYNGELTGLLNAAVTGVPHVGAIQQYASAALATAERKRTRLIGERLVNVALNNGDIEAAKMQAAGDLMESVQIQETSPADVIADADIAQMRAWAADPLQSGQVRGIPTRLIDMDRLLNGLWSGFYIVAARPSIGKTALAVRVAANVAHSAAVLYCTFEQNKAQIWRRIVCANAGIAYKEARKGLARLDLQRYESTAATLRQLPIHFYDGVDSGGRDLAMVSAAILRFARQHDGPKVIFLDNLGHICTDDKETYKELGTVTKQLLQLSNRLDATIIALHQLSRGVESRPDKHPLLSDLRDSGYVEENADVVTMLYRDEYYNPGTETPNILEAAVLKNRLDGALGQMSFFRNPHTGDVLDATTGRI